MDPGFFTGNVHACSDFHACLWFSWEIAGMALCKGPLLSARVAITLAVLARQKEGGREPGALLEPGGSGVWSDRQADQCKQLRIYSHVPGA